jgi:hypothetical protein
MVAVTSYSEVAGASTTYTDGKNRLLKAAAPELYQPYQL